MLTHDAWMAAGVTVVWGVRLVHAAVTPPPGDGDFDGRAAAAAAAAAAVAEPPQPPQPIQPPQPPQPPQPSQPPQQAASGVVLLLGFAEPESESAEPGSSPCRFRQFLRWLGTEEQASVPATVHVYKTPVSTE